MTAAHLELTEAGREAACDSAALAVCVWCRRRLEPDDEVVLVSGRALHARPCDHELARAILGDANIVDEPTSATIAAALGEARWWDASLVALALGITDNEFARFERGDVDAAMPIPMRQKLAGLLRLHAADVVAWAREIESTCETPL
jgi:hypothetical protein